MSIHFSPYHAWALFEEVDLRLVAPHRLHEQLVSALWRAGAITPAGMIDTQRRRVQVGVQASVREQETAALGIERGVFALWPTQLEYPNDIYDEVMDLPSEDRRLVLFLHMSVLPEGWQRDDDMMSFAYDWIVTLDADGPFAAVSIYGTTHAPRAFDEVLREEARRVGAHDLR